MLDAEQLRKAPTRPVAEHVQWIAEGRPRIANTDALMACLATIVLHSGWAWRPRLAARQ
jgi:hypothetical protein